MMDLFTKGDVCSGQGKDTPCLVGQDMGATVAKNTVWWLRHRLFYGPTSIYQKGCVEEDSKSANRNNLVFSLPADSTSDIHLSGMFRLDESILKEGLMCFCRYLNASCPSIDEKAMWQGYYHQKYGGHFWSYPILYALCCLGSKMSENQGIVDAAPTIARQVHKMLKSSPKQHIVMIQATLAMALYELGAGNDTEGWLLSGSAFRMAQDMGLNQAPKFLVSDAASPISTHDVFMRRRVYWGCYATDKFISMYLGRPMHLREDESSVDCLDLHDGQLEEQPELPEHLASFPMATMSLRPMFAHTVRISQIIDCIITLNRHFIRPTPGFALKSQSQETCISSVEAIMALTRHYRAQHGLIRAPLYLVYSLAMAATAAILTTPSDAVANSVEKPEESLQQLNFLVRSLKECSKTYDVARRVVEGLERSRRRRRDTKVATRTNDSLVVEAVVEMSSKSVDGVDDLENLWWDDDDLFDLQSGSFGWEYSYGPDKTDCNRLVLYLHGGPGRSTSKKDARYFNPEVFRVILYDQRGAGKSTPSAELRENDSQVLAGDIEKLRAHLNIATTWYLIFGGSWGSTLALLYTQTFPSNISNLKAAARSWNTWDMTIGSLEPTPESFAKIDDDKWSLSHVRLEAHFFAHGA
ncbi:proline iminopeptidase [Fusarium austroafricanum]|uniref:Proline iminopeptidase n=1 Tax=Fusarium austroafricanum TaxID=2364996 RepID=A0A8H4KF23_9HYPO|nr:proline iminopeptidase [Fusarium austroafricanum]